MVGLLLYVAIGEWMGTKFSKANCWISGRSSLHNSYIGKDNRVMAIHCKQAVISLVAAAVFLVLGCSHEEGREQAAELQAVPLNTGKIITPTTRTSWGVGNMPMSMAITPDGKYVLASDMGYHQWLWSISTADGAGVSSLSFETGAAPGKKHYKVKKPGGEDEDIPTPAGSPKSNGLYYGLAVGSNHLAYAAQGAHDSIAVLEIGDDGTLEQSDSIATQLHDFPAGLALDDKGLLYVANNTSGDGDPFRLSGSVAIYDPSTKAELGRYVFSASHGGTSNFPLGIAVLKNGATAYVAAERDDAVYALDTRDPKNPQLLAQIATGAHPVAVLLSQDQSRLYVANSLSDTVSVIDTDSSKVVGTILLRPDMARDLPGVSPTGLAMSPDGKAMYVTLGDMNAVAVVDAGAMQLSGYIPAGWYPSAVVPLGNDRLLVANAKGTSVRNPNNKPDPHDARRKTGYSLSVLEGNVCTVELPDDASDLKEATEQVLKDNRLTGLEKQGANPLAGIGLSSGNITHVIYIIKENRTYDQVLGDLPQGNGDPSLVLFGRDVTPNQHALAERFVLADDLYACGEVSGDGWCWSTQGMADAYVIRNVPYNYSGRGRKFDFEGHNNGYPTGGFPATDVDGKPVSTMPSFANGAPAIPNVASTGRSIWDVAEEAGISMRNYGFMLTFRDRSAGLANGPDNYPAFGGLMPPGHDLAGVSDSDYRRFDLEYADSDASSQLASQTGNLDTLFKMQTYGKDNEPSRFSEWNKEFQEMLASKPDGSAVPALMLVRLPNDHTTGAKPGKHTPRSYVADNDYAMGQIVQAVSHSAIWKHTAIFVIEDDAQSGVDHVDAHRTTGYVISPWIKQGSVYRQFCNTDSMLKTIELLLGLPPLSQYDAVADPIMAWNDSPANDAPFDAIMPAASLISELNPEKSDLSASDPRMQMAIRSEKMDFSHADAAPAAELDEITWKTVKGADALMPRMHQALPGAEGKDDDDN
jgi:YVTN family beta-propeller protein